MAVVDILNPMTGTSSEELLSRVRLGHNRVIIINAHLTAGMNLKFSGRTKGDSDIGPIEI